MPEPSIAQHLPRDIIFAILKDTVRSTIPEERSLTALTLSHVCSSFYRAALHCPTIWTCLSRRLGRPGLALIEACMERSQGHPLEVSFYFYAVELSPPTMHSLGEQTLAMDNMVEFVLSSSFRWRSCSIHLTGDDTCSELSSATLDLDSFARRINIAAPMLEDFSIEEHASLADRFCFQSRDRSGIIDFNPGAHWSLPNPRNVTLRNSLPNRIPRSSGRIECLRLFVTKDDMGFADLVLHLPSLASLSSLTHLYLSLINFHIGLVEYTQQIPLSECRGIELGL
ncbi:hypothetical protein SCHPADRAFT_938696 [Schizopora paradoxa]|uniref:Uncharacterized protein n=1 Tax=Schizopora paradoxa TaxID=27342 RepID=A0A0H2RUD3_9AGAM|nr:hypothetical protein SCHPADRAFT_938696 [Schizopora paradoxa]